MTRFALPGLTAVGLVFAAAAGFAQQPQTTPNTDQPKMEHGQMGGTGQAQPGPGMGQKGIEMGKQGVGMGQHAPGPQGGAGMGQKGMEMGKQGMGMGQQSPAQNTDQSGTGAGSSGQAQPQGTQGMGQQGQGMGQGGMMKDMHQMMHPSGASPTNPPAAAAPAPQTGQAPAPAPQCPAGTTVQMDANGQHVCK